MKKFLGGMLAGYLLGEIWGAYQMGYFSRIKEVFVMSMEQAERGEPFDFGKTYEHITQTPLPFSKKTSTVTEDREAWVEKTTREYHEKLSRVRAMHAEGYTNADIADAMGIPENSVRTLLESIEEIQ